MFPSAWAISPLFRFFYYFYVLLFVAWYDVCLRAVLMVHIQGGYYVRRAAAAAPRSLWPTIPPPLLGSVVVLLSLCWSLGSWGSVGLFIFTIWV